MDRKPVFTKYKYQPGFNTPVDPQIVGERFEELEGKLQHPLTKEIILDDAAPIASPLHPAFEWDNTIAAHKFRLEQAGDLLRNVVRVTVQISESGREQEIHSVRALDHVTKNGATGYVNHPLVMRQPDLRQQKVEDLRKELLNWVERSREYAELAWLTNGILQVLEAKADAA